MRFIDSKISKRSLRTSIDHRNLPLHWAWFWPRRPHVSRPAATWNRLTKTVAAGDPGPFPPRWRTRSPVVPSPAEPWRWYLLKSTSSGSQSVVVVVVGIVVWVGCRGSCFLRCRQRGEEVFASSTRHLSWSAGDDDLVGSGCDCDVELVWSDQDAQRNSSCRRPRLWPHYWYLSSWSKIEWCLTRNAEKND